MKRFAPVWLTIAAAALAQEMPPHDHKDRRPMPELSVQATVAAAPNKGFSGETVWIIDASGTADYPNGAVMVVDLKLEDGDAYVQRKGEGKVLDGKWRLKEPMSFGMDLWKGDFIVRCSFEPQLQALGFDRYLNPAKSGDRNSATTKLRVGTDEEMKAERELALQFYLRNARKAEKHLKSIEEAWAKQKQKPDARDWENFWVDLTGALPEPDRELADFRYSRENVALPKLYAELSRVYAAAQTTLPLLMGEAFPNGQPSAPKVKAGDEALASVRVSLDAVHAMLKDTQEDPNWKLPVPPKRGAQPQREPPVDSMVQDARPVSGPTGPQPRKPQKSWGVSSMEVGVGFAVLCGVAVLLMMLRRK